MAKLLFITQKVDKDDDILGVYHRWIEKLAERYKNYENFLFLGRRYNFPVALEGALKLKEISYQEKF